MIVSNSTIINSHNQTYDVPVGLLNMLFFLCLMLCAPVVLSINVDQWLIQKIQVADGLPNATVFSVQQDHDGFLWFGTVDGVARYDGYDFKVYQHDGIDINSISNNNAGNIFIDNNNIMWVGTFGGGFNTIDLNTGQITRYPYSSENKELVVPEFVQTFYQDSQSNTWIGTPNGLFKYTDKIIKHYQHDDTAQNSLIHSRVWDIVEDQAGQLWVATSQGLSRLDPKTDEITNFKLPADLVEEISSNELRQLNLLDTELWIASSSALYLFDLTTLEFRSYPLKYNIKINDLMLVDDTFLVATMGGLYQFDRTLKSYITDDNGELLVALANTDLRRMLIDQSGLLWIASRDSGVFKIDQTGGLFVNQTIDYDGEKNNLRQQIWSIELGRNGNKYLGTSDTLIIQTPSGQTIPIGIPGQHKIPGRIRSLEWGQNDDLWIGSSDGLFVLKRGEVIANEAPEPFNLVGIKPADVFSIEVTQAGEIWLSLSNLGVLRWFPKEQQAQLIQNHQDLVLTDISLGKITEDAAQNIWISSDLIGLIKYDTMKDEMSVFRHDFTGANSIASNRVRDVYQDHQGRLWVATEKGISIYHPDTGKFDHLGIAEGLLDPSIFAVLEDSNHHIWASHNFGISRINQANNEIRNFKINSLIRKDGLNIRAANISDEGELYFGSINGLYSFNPNELQSCIEYRPNLLLTQVSINNKPLSTMQLAKKGNRFDLFHQDRTVFFEFSALEYSGPDHVQYSYRTTDDNDNWHDVTTSRHIELSNLKPGEYTLEIQASNSDCRWTEQNLVVTIVVHPVWWNLWWVRLLFIVVGVLVALSMHYFRSRIIRNRNLELEQLVENRTSELTLLNQKLEMASQTDFLTGLNNRAGFVSRFNRLFSKDNSGYIVLADIDHFKKINDMHGHLVGDKALVAVADIMQSKVDGVDILARWGGEEFIFYFANKNGDEVFEIIEKTRIDIQNTPVSYADEKISVTCTFGICQIQPGMGLNDSIKAADQLMYSGKSKGRNATVVSPD